MQHNDPGAEIFLIFTKKFFVRKGVIRGQQALFARCLRGKNGCDFTSGKTIARHDSGNLRFDFAIDHQDSVYLLTISTGLNQ